MLNKNKPPKAKETENQIDEYQKQSSHKVDCKSKDRTTTVDKATSDLEKEKKQPKKPSLFFFLQPKGRTAKNK